MSYSIPEILDAYGNATTEIEKAGMLSLLSRTKVDFDTWKDVHDRHEDPAIKATALRQMAMTADSIDRVITLLSTAPRGSQIEAHAMNVLHSAMEQ